MLVLTWRDTVMDSIVLAVTGKNGLSRQDKRGNPAMNN
jgi:hypothetical protein